MKGSEGLRWSATWSTRENDKEYQFRRELAGKLGGKGWLFPMFPVEYGGLGLTIDHQLVLETELDRYGINLSHVGGENNGWKVANTHLERHHHRNAAPWRTDARSFAAWSGDIDHTSRRFHGIGCRGAI